jgi:hypothetical protein
MSYAPSSYAVALLRPYAMPSTMTVQLVPREPIEAPSGAAFPCHVPYRNIGQHRHRADDLLLAVGRLSRALLAIVGICYAGTLFSFGRKTERWGVQVVRASVVPSRERLTWTIQVGSAAARPSRASGRFGA